MDKITNSGKSSSTDSDSFGFFKYVFNFDDENKHLLLNMLQYTVLAIIPVMLLLKTTKYIVPEEDDSKGSLEILAESVGQILFIMLAVWFTNKIIRYIPTYSGEEYGKFNETNFIIPFVIILATLQTKLGAKLNILADRVGLLWTGKTASSTTAKQGNGGGTVKVSQPLAGGGNGGGYAPQHQPSQADYLDRNQILPSNPSMSAMPQQQAPRQSPDFNQMYQNQATGMPGAMEPMAANEGFGGFSSW